VRRAWLDFCQDAGNRREAAKQSHVALFDMFDRYRALSADERRVVDELLAELAISLDENIRFDALALIGEFRIAAALPALRALAARLEEETFPGAPYEWAKVNRMIGEIDYQSPSTTP
jgi:hypothetical protein